MVTALLQLVVVTVALLQRTAPAPDVPVRLVTQSAPAPVAQVEVSPDGSRLFTLERGAIRVWDLASGREWQWLRSPDDITEFRVHRSAGVVVAFEPFALVTFDPERGVETRRCELLGPESVRSSSLMTMAPSPVSREMLIAMHEGFAIIDVTSCRLSMRRTLGGLVTALDWSPDGSAIVVAAEDTNGADRLEFWRKGDNRPRQSFPFASTIENVSVSKRGRLAVACGDGTAVIGTVGAAGLTILRTVPGTERIATVEWFEDEERLLVRTVDYTFSSQGSAGPSGGQVHVVNADTNERQRLDEGWNLDAAVLPGGRVAAGDEDSTTIFDVASSGVLQTLRGEAAQTTSAAFQQDGGVAVGLSDGSVRLWPALGASALVPQPATPERTEGAVVSNGKDVLALGAFRAFVWNLAEPEGVKPLLRRAVFDDIEWSSDRRRLLYRRGYTDVEVVEAATGNVLCAQKQDSGSNAAALSPDGRTVVMFSPDPDSPGLIDTPRGLLPKENLATIRDADTCEDLGLVIGEFWRGEGGFSPDGRLLYFASSDSIVVYEFVRRPEQPITSKFRLTTANPALSRIAPNGRTLTSIDRDGRLVWWSLETGRQLGAIDTNIWRPHSLDFSPEGRFVLTTGLDGAVRIISLDERRWVATLTSLVDGGWTVVDPDGRYDASDPDRSSGLHWIIGRNAVEIGQIPARRYYVPNLLSSILAGRALPDVAGRLGQLGSPPGVEVAPLKKGDTEFRVTLTNTGGGLGRVEAWVNKKQLRGSFEPADPSAGSATLVIPLQGAAFKTTGDDQLDVVAYSASDGVATRPTTVLVRTSRADEIAARSDPVLTKPPVVTELTDPATHLYGLFIGTSTHRNASLNLRFSSKDAIAMHKAVGIGAGRFFPSGRVHLSLLSSEDEREENHPSKKNILRELGRIAAAAKPEDTVLVYFAGHGIAMGKDRFHYLTSEATALEDTDDASRDANTISSDELREWLQVRIGALKMVLILDTCAAGAAAEDLSAPRTLSGDQVRALHMLRKATGSFVLMGSAADRFSYEASRYEQGLLTYALLAAMSGQDMPEGEQLWVGSWLNYAEREVPRLADHIGGIQQPYLLRPRGHDFPLMTFTAEDRRAIPLASPKAGIVRPLVTGERTRDLREVRTALRERLKLLSAPVPRGTGTAGGVVLYLDNGTGDIPWAYEPHIICRTTNQGLEATIRLFRDSNEIGEPSIVILPDAAQVAAEMLADAIVDMTLRAAKQAPAGGRSGTGPSSIPRDRS